MENKWKKIAIVFIVLFSLTLISSVIIIDYWITEWESCVDSYVDCSEIFTDCSTKLGECSNVLHNCMEVVDLE